MRLAGEQDWEVGSADDVFLAMGEVAKILDRSLATYDKRRYKLKIMFDVEDA